jgi:dTDP-4-dehydrorhamnose 3,5-epimerase
MIFEPTPLDGAFVIVPEPITDNRGFFARLFCVATFAERGLDPHLDQISMSHNTHAGTVRGLHLQRPPAAEVKIVRVTAGAIFDVIVDLRAGSQTYGRWFGTELSAANRKLFYIPEGFAHGFQTIEPATEVTYHISRPYAADLATGLPYDDPDLGISWPLAGPVTISERDAAWPPFRDFAPIENGHG